MAVISRPASPPIPRAGVPVRARGCSSPSYLPSYLPTYRVIVCRTRVRACVRACVCLCESGCVCVRVRACGVSAFQCRLSRLPLGSCMSSSATKKGLARREACLVPYLQSLESSVGSVPVWCGSEPTAYALNTPASGRENGVVQRVQSTVGTRGASRASAAEYGRLQRTRVLSRQRRWEDTNAHSASREACSRCSCALSSLAE